MPWNDKNTYIESYKQSKRRDDDIAIVTAALAMRVDDNRKITDCVLSYGGLAPRTVEAKKTGEFLIGKQFTEATFGEAYKQLRNEVGLTGDPPGGMAEFRTTLAISFLYKFYVSILTNIAPSEVDPKISSATMKLFESKLPHATHTYDVPKRGTSVGDNEPHLASKKQTTGEALYTTDIPHYPRELQAFLVGSARAHAKIKSIDYSEALKYPGVHGVLTHKDVPGDNIWGDIVHDEELFASEQVYQYGQPIAVVLADTEHAAKHASKLVKIEYEDLPDPIYSIEDAIKHNSFFPTVHKVKDGSLEQGFKESDKVVDGHINMCGQEQFYFETQTTVAVPEETDMIIYSSTQNANKTQKIVALSLGIPANRVR
jgi:xanthine dehydrogenase/oxidase